MAYVGYKDKDKRRKYHREYMKRYMRAFRARCKREGRPYWNTKYGEQLKIKVMGVLGGQRCANCGCTELKILEINHVNGGGRKECPKQSARYKVFRDIVAGRVDKKRYNVLCRVCNAAHYVADILGLKGHTIAWSPAS